MAEGTSPANEGEDKDVERRWKQTDGLSVLCLRPTKILRSGCKRGTPQAQSSVVFISVTHLNSPSFK